MLTTTNTVGRLVKERTDIVRVRVDYLPWLDAGEILDSIQDYWVAADTSGWASSAPPYPAIDDLTPLEIQEIQITGGGTEIEMFLAGGSPTNTYTVTFIARGSSARELTTEVGVQISGVPYTITTEPTVLLADGAISRLGDIMMGPLYLFEDPLVPSEAATKRYVDRLRGFVEDEFRAADAIEKAERIAADDALAVELANEEASRVAADATLSTAISNETTARTNADTTERNARIAADSSEATARANGDSNEATARANADAALNAAIAAETAARVAADSTGSGSVSSEAATRAAADTALGVRIDNEATTRNASDVALAAAIAALPPPGSNPLPTGYSIRFGNTASDVGGHFTVTFSPAFPSGIASVVVSAHNDSWWASINSFSASGFSGSTASPLVGGTWLGGPINVSWIAIGN